MSVAVSAIASTIGSCLPLVNALIAERDRLKAAAIQLDLTERLLKAQTDLAQILGAIVEKEGLIQSLAERNRELEAQQRERERYVLAKLGVVGDFYAYRLRPRSELLERADEPDHFLCQPCFDAGKKVVLNIGHGIAHCPLCKHSVAVEPQRPAGRR